MIKFSVIIPVYNCEKEIARLLDSIAAQDWNKSDYEVIVCNDKSTDKCMDIIKSYSDKINIVLCETEEREIHCPGNTRLDGLKYARGEWITFIDNDDFFEPKAFDKVLKRIEEVPSANVICGNFREVDNEQCLNEYIKSDTWLHGKWYRRKFLIDNNITFKENLFTHEDVYFNFLVLCNLIGKGEDYVYLDKFLYNWVNNINSLSRKPLQEGNCYIELYLNDYIMANIESGIEGLKKYPHIKDFVLNNLIMTLLHSYFYYQSFLYCKGKDRYNNYNYILKLISFIMENFGLTKENIVDYIYSKPLIYKNVKLKCLNGSYNFIELQSFKDFIAAAALGTSE